jgi:hypothetical protein
VKVYLIIHTMASSATPATSAAPQASSTIPPALVLQYKTIAKDIQSATTALERNGPAAFRRL